MTRRALHPSLSLYVLLLVGAAVNLVPFAWMVSTSLKTRSEAFAYPPTWLPHTVAWGNYGDAFGTVSGRVFLNSLIVASSIVILQGLVTTMGGFAFARLRFPLRDQLFLLYLGTMLIPPQVTLLPSFIVVVRLGWIDSYQGLIVPIVAQGAFGTFLFRQFFLKIPNELFDAAKLDGANPWRQYAHLALPLSGPALAAYGVLTFLTSWNMYLWPLIVVRSPELKTAPLAIAELSGGFAPDRGVEMAAVSLSIVPVLLIWIVGQRWFVAGISMTGMKG